MQKQIGVALGAGLASALLFVVSAKGSTAAALIAYFTALPIIIAALGFGHLSGLAGVLLGGGAVAVGLGPVLAVFFALCFALPGWGLAYLAQLAQPDTGLATKPDTGLATTGTPALIWYPVGRLVTWAAGFAAAAVLALGGVVLWRYGGYDHATQALTGRLAEALETGPSAAGAASVFVRVLPLAMAASLFLMLCINLYLGARIARVSQRLTRPWPNIPDGLRLPPAAAGVFILALAPTLYGGLVGTACGVVASALGLAFAMQGLAAAHVLTRGFGGRGAILALIYIVTVAIPVAIVALTLIGLVDCLFALRSRRPPSPPKPLSP